MPQDLDFEVRMPTRWNGRTVFIGGGGFDGSIGNRFISAGASAPGGASGPGGEAGYATIATNHGHDARVTPDASFALDVQMLAEYAYLAVPRVLAPAKAILRAHYGAAFDGAKMVYEGCSGGGRQGLIQAQRYPDLFDGVVARAPATAFVSQFLWYGKVAKLHAAPGGALARLEIEAIGSAVRAKCDGLDGLVDGIISRPAACEFDPGDLACKAGETDTCLTPPQVATARAYYEPTNVANGRYTWPGFMPGGETPSSWLNNLTDHFESPLFNGFMRYMVMRDASVDPLAVDPEKHLPRLDYLSAAIDAVDPDLGRFKASGGKLILWTGQADWLITANNATAYYQSVVDTMGGQSVVDEFMEYYTSPDVQHCGGGAGADRIDLVTPMFEWLEKGIKPSAGTIVATKFAAGPRPLARPLCRFPRYPQYVGGDQGSAASFTCAAPDDESK
jgi:feruloyl esterase